MAEFFYPDKINEHFSAAKNAGNLKHANAVGAGASFVCGTFVRFFLEIDVETKEIKAAKFKSNGCGYAIAAADVLAEIVVGRKLIELHGLDKQFQRRKIEEELGEFSAHRKHCADICIDALQNALADFRVSQLIEFSGEKALICTCFGVSEETIENLILENNLGTVEEVTRLCNAGGGCGSCRILIEEMISDF